MHDDESRHWTIRASTYRVDEPFLRVRSDTVELPDGTVIENYFVRESRGFAVIAALTQDRRIVLVRQYKHGIGKVVLELPGGMIDPGEAPLDCALRELAEETGYVGDSPRLLRSMFVDPTSSDGTFHVFLVENAGPRFEQSLDRTESIEIVTVPLADYRAAVHDGRINSGAQVAAAHVLLGYLGEP